MGHVHGPEKELSKRLLNEKRSMGSIGPRAPFSTPVPPFPYGMSYTASISFILSKRKTLGAFVCILPNWTTLS